MRPAPAARGLRSCCRFCRCHALGPRTYSGKSHRGNGERELTSPPPLADRGEREPKGGPSRAEAEREFAALQYSSIQMTTTNALRSMYTHNALTHTHTHTHTHTPARPTLIPSRIISKPVPASLYHDHRGDSATPIMNSSSPTVMFPVIAFPPVATWRTSHRRSDRRRTKAHITSN